MTLKLADTKVALIKGTVSQDIRLFMKKTKKFAKPFQPVHMYIVHCSHCMWPRESLLSKENIGRKSLDTVPFFWHLQIVCQFKAGSVLNKRTQIQLFFLWISSLTKQPFIINYFYFQVKSRRFSGHAGTRETCSARTLKTR